jgi:hypothetical protein
MHGLRKVAWRVASLLGASLEADGYEKQRLVRQKIRIVAVLADLASGQQGST